MASTNSVFDISSQFITSAIQMNDFPCRVSDFASWVEASACWMDGSASQVNDSASWEEAYGKSGE
jgi:hypothetical protein